MREKEDPRQTSDAGLHSSADIDRQKAREAQRNRGADPDNPSGAKEDTTGPSNEIDEPVTEHQKGNE